MNRKNQNKNRCTYKLNGNLIYTSNYAVLSRYDTVAKFNIKLNSTWKKVNRFPSY